MDFKVLLQVSSLGEYGGATGKATGIWFVVCVNSEVIEEIVPLIENLVAVLVITKHLLGCQLGLKTLILKDNEIVHLRDFLLYLDLVQVEFISFVDQY